MKRFLFLGVGGMLLLVCLAGLYRLHLVRVESAVQRTRGAIATPAVGADTNGSAAAMAAPVPPPAAATNPYAAALREPGKSKRAWSADFLKQFQQAATGDPIRFELTQGLMASGVIKLTQLREGEVTYISGELTEPEQGKFFFLTPPPGGKAGKAAGVVEFWGSQTAYRVEPTGPDGEPELWQRRLDEVLCLAMPLMDTSAAHQGTANIPPLRPDAVPDYSPGYNSNVVSLQSYPGSSAVLLLDFFGGYTPTWGGVTYPKPSVSNSDIKDLWKRVAEDYLPFNINVTTDLRVYQNAPATSRQKCVFTPSTSAMPSGAAGVAYIGSWNWGSDTVCWSLYTSGKAGGEVGSHEPGHTLGLGHQTQEIPNGSGGFTHNEYFSGQGSGVTGWAPIMGAGYYDNVVTWAKGEFLYASNTNDALQTITTANNNVSYRPDDTGSTLATSRYLELYPDFTASAEGVIERTADSDAFQFTTTGGLVSLTANPVGDWADLAISATIMNSNDVVILTNNPQTSLSAGFSSTLPAGTYTFVVTGAGRNSPLTNGFSSYASLGYYSITGSVAGARLPTRLSVAEHAPNGTTVGLVSPLTAGSPLAYAIVLGNTNSTFSLDNSGVLRVANNTLLDYDRLATNTMFPVRFELLVNISNLSNPALTELKRRVVVAVTPVAVAPVVTGFTSTVLEHTQVGLAVGVVKVTDANLAPIFNYSLVSGNSNGVFAIDSWGNLTVAGDISAAVQKTYTLGVAVSDNAVGYGLSGTGYVTLTVVSNPSPFRPGSISYALYDNIGSGQLVTDLTGNARWPRDPSSELQMPTFEGINNRADNYGAAMRGYLIPPVSGTYTFWIATDDNGELWMNTTTSSTNTTPISRLAYISGANYYAAPRQWNKFASQQSAALYLTAGQAYYIEARMKEGGGGDNIAVAWKGPPTAGQTNVIPGSYLAPYLMNYIPHLTGFSASIHQGAINGTAVGQMTVADVNAGDAHTFAITSGNTAGLFMIDPNTGVVRVADDAGLLAAAPGSYGLQVQTTDSGSPPQSATASATITLVANNAITATTIQQEMWNNIGGGTAVSDLTNNAAFPGRPDTLNALTTFASAVNIADNYGSRIRAYLTPATSGAYQFFISSDDNSSLLLSTTDSPSNAARVAYVPGWTAVNTWTTYAQQTSAAINLVGGQRYYIEALHKEGGGGDHVEVAWAGPGIVDGNGLASTNIIDGSFLAPYDINYSPTMANQTLRVFSSVANGTGIGRVLALDSGLDTLSFKIVAGNPNGMFAITSDGIISVVDNTLIASGAATTFPLTVMVQDSGYGGLYPLHSAQATVTVSVVAPGAVFAWTGAGGTNNWGNAGNWGGVVPGAGARLVFGAPWLQSNLNEVLSALTSVQFTNGGFNLTGNPVTLQSGLTNSGDNTWGLNTTLAAAQTWQNASGTFTAGGAISNNVFTLNVVASSDFRIAGPVSGSGGLYKSGVARLLMSGAHSYSGQTTILAATNTALEVNGTDDLNLGNSDLYLAGKMDLWNHNATVGALLGNGAVFANDLTRTLTVGANNHSGNFSGTLQNSSYGSGVTLDLVKTGSGTQTLSGPNSYSGLTVVAGGVLSVANAAALGATNGSLMVLTGGTLAVSGSFNFGAKSLNLNGSGMGGTGALRNDAGYSSFSGALTLSGPTTIRAGTGRLTLAGGWNTADHALTFDTASGAGVVVSSPIGGAGGLVKTGVGSAILNGANWLMGAVAVNQGTLALGASGSLAWSSGLSLGPGAVLDVSAIASGWTLGATQSLQGFGTVSGTVLINGTLMPGGSIGTLALNGYATLAGNTVLEISKTGGVVTSDLLTCSATLTLGGLLTVTNIGTDALAAGDAFTLFSAGKLAGSFVTITLPPLGAYLAWDTSTLGVDGTIRVVGTEPSVAPSLVFAASGGWLSLSWPTSYSSFTLVSQTNPPGQGLGSNWVWAFVPGVTNNSIILPIDTNNGSVFYRLFK